MTKYSLLNHRRMSNEIRLSYRQAIVIAISTFIAFIYAFSRGSCAESATNLASSVLNENLNLPIIYAVTPTYYRPVQKAELTRYKSFCIFHDLYGDDEFFSQLSLIFHSTYLNLNQAIALVSSCTKFILDNCRGC